MRNIFQRIPFLRITSLFIAGVLLQYFIHPEIHLIAAILGLLIVFLFLFWHNNSFTTIRIQNAVLSVLILITGIFYSSDPNQNQPTAFDQKEYFLAEVCQKPSEKAKTFQTILYLQNDNHPGTDKVVAYFKKTAFDSTLTTGDRLIILAKPQRLRNTGNPYEFDYCKMMANRGIWYSVYLESGTYLKIGKQIHSIENLAEMTRDKLIAKFSEVLPNREERSVVSALTLGYRAEIAQDTLDYFASTGAMHVLSVSGLHVALIYMILGFLLAFLKRGKAGPILFSAIMLSFLWIYAFISGFSPPVQRATVMFTFVIIGNNIRRPVNIYNSLTASALFLILLNPSVLFDVGFQLSYLAIFGIVLIQPILFNLLELTNPILKWLWALFTVSVAAQIVTFPLGIFYFSQFPNFFWLSNFIVVPVTTLIMWFTLAFFIVIPIHSLASLAGLIIQKLTWFMLTALKMMDAHPLAISKGIIINTLQTLLLYAIIIAILLFIFSKQNRWLLAGLLAIIALQTSSLLINSELTNQKRILVYNTRAPIIHLINARKNYILAADTLISEYDMRNIRRIIDHLKLDDPIVLKKGYTNRFDDLILENGKARFLNYELNFDFKNPYQPIQINQLTRNKMELADISIYSNINRYKADKTSKQKFCTKTEGAFDLNFRK